MTTVPDEVKLRVLDEFFGGFNLENFYEDLHYCITEGKLPTTRNLPPEARENLWTAMETLPNYQIRVVFEREED